MLLADYGSPRVSEMGLPIQKRLRIAVDERIPRNKNSSLLVFAGFQYVAFCQKLIQVFLSWLATYLLEFKESKVGVAIVLHLQC